MRAIKHIRLSESLGQATESVSLEAEERHVRRKLWHTLEGRDVLVDLPLAVYIEDGDHLELEDGTYLEVQAAEEDLYEITGSSPAHIAQLAWHIGNRHLAAQVEYNRILIKRDHIIKAMLEGLHATVTEIRDQFDPLHGAYHGH
ncbi:MAG: urease accessory protein UreE [Alphaproteobacteria bacterium]|nr:urease accessory protein UreE [Alphaproteobacteria bacterium]